LGKDVPEKGGSTRGAIGRKNELRDLRNIFRDLFPYDKKRRGGGDRGEPINKAKRSPKGLSEGAREGEGNKKSGDQVTRRRVLTMAEPAGGRKGYE